MIRALYFSYMSPYPPYSGYQLRIWNICKQLSRKMDQSILCRVFNPLDSEYIQRVSKENIRIESVVISRPGFYRKLIKALAFLPKGYPLRAVGWYFPAMKKILRQLVSKDNFDLIIIEGSYYGIYWPFIYKTKALKVLDLHNIEEERILREAGTLPAGVRKFIYFYDALRMRYLENKIIDGVDLTLVTSERESQELLRRNYKARVFVAPNGVDCETIRQLPFADNPEILFVGALDYAPNVDGIFFFVNKILPKLHSDFPNLKFRIVGRSPTTEIKKLNGTAGIEVTGQVEDLEPYYRRCALCVVPLRSGGGTRLKILEAMAYGRAVVSTTIGCEGIEAFHNKHILIADEAEEVSDAIISLLINRDLAAFLVNNARSLVEKKYSWDRIAEGIFEQYINLINQRQHLRCDPATSD
ncbi:MAG: glycosyltransferase [Candidatus Omnitrophica bacterium]|nr:glycosyltransferase [Candidatus Omnitrophota bacterium]